VELGKQLGGRVLSALEGGAIAADIDGSTNGLIRAFHRMQQQL
jgi:glucose-6-phosphate isomerase